MGGCNCGRWSDWLWGRVEFVQAHPRAAGFIDFGDDEKMDAEDELILELELAGEMPEPNLRPCETPTCNLFQAQRGTC